MLTDTLRGFVTAYTEDIFPPLTEAERSRLGSSVISRASAAMGRHFGKYAGEAADEIDRLSRKVALASAVIQFYANSSKDAYEADGGHLARTQFSHIFEKD